MEVSRRNGSKDLNLIGILILFCIFSRVACRLHEINQEFLPWPLKVERRGVKDVCETPECREAAEAIKQSLNTSVDPCDDFYEFACGGWIAKHPVLPAEPQRSQFGSISDKLEIEVRDILESPIDPEEPGPVKAAKKYYRACQDTEHMEEQGLGRLLEVIDSLGGWPLAADNWNANNFNWQKTVAKVLRQVGVQPLITLYAYKDQKNSSRSVLITDQTSLTFPRTILLNSETYKVQLDAFRNFAVGVAEEIVMARNKIPHSRITAEIDEVIEFEKKIAEITVPDDQRRDRYRRYNLMTLQQLQNLTDSVNVKNDYARINWKLILDTLFVGVNITFPPDEPIIVNEVAFVPELVKLLDVTPLRVIANYIHLKTATSLSAYTTKRMRYLRFQFRSTLSGATEQSPRWQICVSSTNGNLGMAVAYSYIKKHFNADAKKAAHQMVIGIQSQFSSSIDDVDWMDEATKRVAKEKANEMENKIGYPDWMFNVSALDEYYKGVSVGESHLANVLSLNILEIDEFFAKLRKPTDRSEWPISPQTVNAFYNPLTNSIILPAGILQTPLFDTRRPKALNYGGMGAVIGHEITHGFDDSGRKSDKYGNLAQWWSQDTVDTYVQKTSCFIEQYGSYRVPELDEILKTEAKVNGFNTQGENIADNGGLRQAYFAYKKYVEEHGPEKNLPGLEKYSPESLFFLSYATTWCGSSTLEADLGQILSDSHSPGKFRVLGTLSNTEEFADVWQCPVGSRMNPVKKCRIW